MVPRSLSSPSGHHVLHGPRKSILPIRRHSHLPNSIVSPSRGHRLGSRGSHCDRRLYLFLFRLCLCHDCQSVPSWVAWVFCCSAPTFRSVSVRAGTRLASAAAEFLSASRHQRRQHVFVSLMIIPDAFRGGNQPPGSSVGTRTIAHLGIN